MAASAKDFRAETKTEKHHLVFNAGAYTFFIESAMAEAENETFVSCPPLA
jgi:hypothetical protein